MFRISRLGKLRESTWMQRTVASAPDKIVPPVADEAHEWGIQPVDLGIRVRFEQVRDLVSNACRDFRKHGTDITTSDGILAERLHKLLSGVTRRQAADAGLWAYLAAYGSPEYVCWRWPGSKSLRMAGNIRRNALARLWWWAEVTHDPHRDQDDSGRYEITRQTKGRQDLILWCGDCAFSGNPQVVRRLSELQKDKGLGSEEQQKVCRTVNRMLRTVCIDALPDGDAVRAACDKAYDLGKALMPAK